MLRFAAALALLGLVGCTSVKMVQRDGCWVRRTERWPRRVTEELGPCAAPAAQWSDDRVTRAVQECVARADHRWQMQAQLAWSRGEPLPPSTSDEALYRACLDEPAKALAGDNDLLRRRNDEMKERLADLAHERDALRSSADEERARRESSERERLSVQEQLTNRLLTTQEKAGERLFHGQDALAAYLGEAAKKSSQPAVATANSTSRSDGSASTRNSATTPVTATIPSVPSPSSNPARALARRTSRSVCPAPQESALLPRRAPSPPGCDPAADGVKTGLQTPQTEVVAAPPAPAAAPGPTTPGPAAQAGADDPSGPAGSGTSGEAGP